MDAPEVRRRTMQAVKSKNTRPEMYVRRLLHAQGYRYRLHKRGLPGCPDLVFSSRRKVIFVHGCFWHGHDCARGARVPLHNRAYWINKLSRNKERDEAARAALIASGWKVAVIWECEIGAEARIGPRLRKFLGIPKQ